MVHELKACVHGNASKNAEVTFVKVLLCGWAAKSSRYAMVLGLHTGRACRSCGLCGLSCTRRHYHLPCRNHHPDECRDTTDIFKKSGGDTGANYDASDVGVVLEGRAVMRELPQDTITRMLSKLPKLLTDDPGTIAAAGWCAASEDFLRQLLQDKQLKVQVFRKALLNNGDCMSSTLDLSQPTSDNTWGLVPYSDVSDGSYYICVLQVLYYMRLEVGSDSFHGFDPTVCADFRLQVPVGAKGQCVPHQPLRIAVGRLWLAAGATQSMGALGCRESYDAVAGLPPDMVVVKNLSQDPPLVRGTKRQILASHARGRYYGVSFVHVDDICCQLGRTKYDSADGCHCFLACSKKSGKKG